MSSIRNERHASSRASLGDVMKLLATARDKSSALSVPTPSTVGSWLLCVLALGLAWYSVLLVLDAPSRPAFLGERLREFSIAMRVHIVSSAIALALLPVLLSSTLRRRKPQVHRISGVLSMVSIYAAAFASIQLIPFVPGGVAATAAFYSLGAAWILCNTGAVVQLFRMDFEAHGKWGARCGALTFSGVTLRAYLALASDFGWTNNASLAMVAWLSWVPNLLVVELFLRSARGTRRETPTIRVRPVVDAQSLLTSGPSVRGEHLGVSVRVR